MAQMRGGARFDSTDSAVVVEGLVVDDRDVVCEARRWTCGRRGPAVEETAELAGADLTSFATEALLLGARALTVTAQTTGLIQTNAGKIDSQCTGISTAIHRLLDQALVALAATPASAPAGLDGSASVSGAA